MVNSPQSQSFYQIKHRMHSCDTTILLENVYFTTSNNLTKYLCVASVSSYFTSSLNVRKLAKNDKKRQVWVRHPYLGCQNEPFQYFWARCFYISEIHMFANKRKNHWQDCKWFFTFWQNTGPKKPVYEPSPFVYSLSLTRSTPGLLCTISF